jgi:hypothetical protein
VVIDDNRALTATQTLIGLLPAGYELRIIKAEPPSVVVASAKKEESPASLPLPDVSQDRVPSSQSPSPAPEPVPEYPVDFQIPLEGGPELPVASTSQVKAKETTAGAVEPPAFTSKQIVLERDKSRHSTKGKEVANQDEMPDGFDQGPPPAPASPFPPTSPASFKPLPPPAPKVPKPPAKKAARPPTSKASGTKAAAAAPSAAPSGGQRIIIDISDTSDEDTGKHPGKLPQTRRAKPAAVPSAPASSSSPHKFQRTSELLQLRSGDAPVASSSKLAASPSKAPTSSLQPAADSLEPATSSSNPKSLPSSQSSTHGSFVFPQYDWSSDGSDLPPAIGADPLPGPSHSTPVSKPVVIMAESCSFRSSCAFYLNNAHQQRKSASGHRPRM